MLFRLMIQAIQLIKLTTTKNEYIEKKIPNLNKYITTYESIKLTKENFPEILEKLATILILLNNTLSKMRKKQKICKYLI